MGKQRFNLTALVSGMLLLLASSAAAAPNDRGPSPIAQPANFIELNCTLPAITPNAPALKRGPGPSRETLLRIFFGGEQGVTSTEQVRNPIYGKGTRFKSSRVVYLTKSGMDMRAASSNVVKTEFTAAFLDLYNTGFVYQNNVQHRPVLATRVDTGSGRGKVSQYRVYSDDEGRRTAEATLIEMFGPLKTPAGCQSVVNSAVQDIGARLFVYRVHPEYITTVEVGAGASAQQVRTGIGIQDVFITMQLDGDKLLAGMEYFWDAGVSAIGSPSRGIGAQQALFNAQQSLLKMYNVQPPLISINQVKLGYLLDRKNHTNLQLAWIFDASYKESDYVQTGSSIRGNSPNALLMPLPFAVDAVSGAFIPLWS